MYHYYYTLLFFLLGLEHLVKLLDVLLLDFIVAVVAILILN
jgi:hypothetical protein